MGLTYFIPGGKFETIQYQPDSKEFVIMTVHEQEDERLPVIQEFIDNLQIKIDLNNGAIIKPVTWISISFPCHGKHFL